MAQSKTIKAKVKLVEVVVGGESYRVPEAVATELRAERELHNGCDDAAERARRQVMCQLAEARANGEALRRDAKALRTEVKVLRDTEASLRKTLEETIRDRDAADRTADAEAASADELEARLEREQKIAEEFAACVQAQARVLAEADGYRRG